MPQIVFASFGGPTPNYHRRVNIICTQMRLYFPYIKSIAYTEQDLKNDSEFWNAHQAFMETHPRGYGHWLWKPWIIHKTLQDLSDGDILIYADAGCTINAYGADKLNEYIQMVSDNEFGLFAFSIVPEEAHLEYKWTKKAVLEALDATSDDTNSKQLMATTMIIKKTKHSTELVQKWYDTCSVHSLIDDTLTDSEHPEFKDHRHDQSVFSLLVKKCLVTKPIIIPDETYYWPNWHIDGIDHPIWATRFRQ
jgi:hypothetical protein